MMRALRIDALPAFLFSVACTTGPVPVRAPAAELPAPSAHEEVKSRERHWLDTYERADAEAMGDILADDFVITFPSGRQFNRTDTLNQVRQSRGGTRFWTENVQSEGERPRVVLSGIVVSDSGSRQTRQSYSDVWKWDGSRWQVASSTLSAAPQQ